MFFPLKTEGQGRRKRPLNEEGKQQQGQRGENTSERGKTVSPYILCYTSRHKLRKLLFLVSLLSKSTSCGKAEKFPGKKGRRKKAHYRRPVLANFVSCCFSLSFPLHLPLLLFLGFSFLPLFLPLVCSSRRQHHFAKKGSFSRKNWREIVSTLLLQCFV